MDRKVVDRKERRGGREEGEERRWRGRRGEVVERKERRGSGEEGVEK